MKKNEPTEDLSGNYPSQELLHSALNAATEGVLIFEGEGSERKVQFVNSEFSNISGYTIADLCTEKVGEFARLMDQSGLTPALNLNGKRQLKSLLQAVRKDGRVFWAKVSAVLIDLHAQSKCYVVLLSDATEEVVKEQQLKNNQEQFRGLYTNSPLPVLVIEPVSGVVLDVNLAGKKYFQLEGQQEIVCTFEKFVAPSNGVNIAEIFTNNKTKVPFKIGGAELVAEVHASSAVYGDSLPVKVLYINDITQSVFEVHKKNSTVSIYQALNDLTNQSFTCNEYNKYYAGLIDIVVTHTQAKKIEVFVQESTNHLMMSVANYSKGQFDDGEELGRVVTFPQGITLQEPIRWPGETSDATTKLSSRFPVLTVNGRDLSWSNWSGSETETIKGLVFICLNLDHDANLLMSIGFDNEVLSPLQDYVIDLLHSQLPIVCNKIRASIALDQSSVLLQNSERHYRELIENSGEITLTLGRNNVIKYASPQWKDVFDSDVPMPQDEACFIETLNHYIVGELMSVDVFDVQRGERQITVSTKGVKKHLVMTWNEGSSLPNELIINIRDQSLLIRAELDKQAAIIEVEEKQRHRLAHDLHDGVGQSIAAANMFIRSVTNAAHDHLPAKWIAVFDRGAQLLNKTVGEVRAVSHNFLPRTLVKFGLPDTLIQMIEDYKTVHPLIRFELKIDQLNGKELKETIQVNLYRCVQEMYSNSFKHAKANCIELEILVHPNMIEVVFMDDGQGFDPSSLKGENGIGMDSLKNRIAVMEGDLVIKSSKGNGAQFIIKVPCHS